MQRLYEYHIRQRSLKKKKKNRSENLNLIMLEDNVNNTPITGTHIVIGDRPDHLWTNKPRDGRRRIGDTKYSPWEYSMEQYINFRDRVHVFCKGKISKLWT